MKEAIQKTREWIESVFIDKEGSHDWHHIFRVWKMALQLHEKEGGNSFVIEMAALLHDVNDWKLIDPSQSKINIKGWLKSCNIDEKTADHIITVIQEVSFKGSGVATPCSSIESMIVQDADRLDAIGAVGVARAFAYGGSKGHKLYIPGQEPELHTSFENYRKSGGATLTHFYEKLLLVKERMNTKTAKIIAEERHRYLLDFLEQFKKECHL